MVFSSPEFLFLYLPVSLLIYFFIPSRFLAARNTALLLLSLVFYGWSEPVYITIMFASITIDYTCGHFAGKYRETAPGKAKAAMVTSVVLNLSILGFFKYCDFVIENLALIPALSGLKPLGIKLPVGISFYTFQTMSYTLDVYMGEARVQRNILSFGAYVTMFPQLIAGPIVRYRDVDEALRQRSHTVPLAAEGVRRFLAGLCKKVLLANTAGAIYESFAAGVAATPTVLGSWMGVVFYSFQIYFDFSGYSDMAIGLGKVMGFTFPENFNYPYISRSITDFWRRWHITLSTWFREYVYIPLGGNRRGKMRVFFNLFAVWFLTGLWHGASWNFVLWGLYFWLILVLEKAFLLKLIERVPALFSHVYALLFIVFGWFIFISCDLASPMAYLGAMFASPFTVSTVTYEVVRNLVFLLILCIASTPLPKLIYDLNKEKAAFRAVVSALCPLALILCVAYLVDSSYNPFLYFRF